MGLTQGAFALGEANPSDTTAATKLTADSNAVQHLPRLVRT